MSFVGISVLLLVIALIGGILFAGQVGFGISANSLSELIENSVIDTEEAEKIKNYYRTKRENSKLGVIILSLVGIVLISLGVILIVAHNWYSIPKFVKISISIVMLLIAQVIFIYNIAKKRKGILAVEGSSIFLAGILAATIALVSQIYNIEGNFEDFMLTWMITVLPIPYLYGSAIVAMLYSIGITMWYTSISYVTGEATIYANLLLVIAILPFVLNYIRKHTNTLRARILEIVIFIIVLYDFGGVLSKTSNIVAPFLVFNILLVCIYFVTRYFKKLKLYSTHLITEISIIIQMLILAATTEFYSDAFNGDGHISEFPIGNSIVLILLIVALCSFYYFVRRKEYTDAIYALTTIIISMFSYLMEGRYLFITTNLYVIGLAMYLIVSANISMSMYKLNLGLIVTIVMILKWFGDMNFDIITRGIGFIVFGVILVSLNLRTIRKKKEVLKDE